MDFSNLPQITIASCHFSFFDSEVGQIGAEFLVVYSRVCVTFLSHLLLPV